MAVHATFQREQFMGMSASNQLSTYLERVDEVVVESRKRAASNIGFSFYAEVFVANLYIWKYNAHPEQ